VEAFVSEVARRVAEAIGRSVEEVEDQVQPSKDPARGDLSLPCFKLAAALGRKGKDGARGLAAELAEGLPGGVVRSAEATGPFVNLRLDPAAVAEGVLRPAWERERSAASDEGAGETVVIDFSSPNIAKPFHLGHLRSTVIGWSLRQIFRALGYEVVGVNHLGDWGTQFGFMIAGWKRWEEEAERRIETERDIDVFYDLYVRINALGKEKTPEGRAVREEAQAWFRRLEEGDPEAKRLHQFFVDRSKVEFGRIYELLGVRFESDAGEAFYEDEMPAALERLKASGLLTEGLTKTEAAEQKKALAERRLESAKRDVAKAREDLAALEAEGKAAAKKGQKLERKIEKTEASLGELEAAVADAAREVEAAAAKDDGSRPLGVDLGERLGFCMLQKGDGGTTYTTRDVAAALYRGETYRPARIVYVTGNEQRDHFLPWFEVVKKLDEPWAGGLVHVGFGKYRGMSTRGGTAVFLDEVLERARERAREAAAAATKKVELSDAERERVARAIGTGAVKFFDLRAERNKDIDLSAEGGGIDWDRLLDLKGETGPYLQFAYARLAGILRRYEGEVTADVDYGLLGEPEALALVKALAELPATVRAAAERYEPSVISRYLIDLSQRTHVFVHHHRVLDATPGEEQAAAGATPEALRAARVLLVACAKKAIGEALDLLGIEALEQM